MTVFRILTRLFILGAAAAIVAGFFGRVHPGFDTIANFRLHLGVALVAACIFCVFRKHLLWAVFAVLFGLFGIHHSTNGTVFSTKTLAADPARPVYKLLHYNLLWNNSMQENAIALFRKTDADIMTLTEASVLWDRAFESIGDQWPYFYHCPEWNKRGGVKIFSKWPIADDSTFCGRYGSFGKAQVTLGGNQPVIIGAAHLRWPWPASGPRQIDALQHELGKLKENVLIGGDFNSATWTWGIQRFANYGALEIQPGIGSTWIIDWFPNALAKWIGLPIDNVLYKGNVSVLSARTLSSHGSDHLPVLVEFQLH